MSFDLNNIDPAVLAMIPAVAPPDGVQSNFDHPASLDRLAQITVYVALPITFVVSLLRLYVRAKVQRSWGADDCKFSEIAGMKDVTDQMP
jgi:hypothetical protein